MFDLFAQIFSGITGVAAQTTAQTTTPPAHSANTLANLFQFDADGGAGWASSAFGEPPEWAPWHPDFDEFAHYGPNGKEGGIGLTPHGLGSAGFPNTMSRGNGQTSQTPPLPSQAPQSSSGGSYSNTGTSSSSGGGSTGTTSLAERNALPPGHDKYVDDAKEVNNPNVSETITKATAPTIPELPERNPIAEDKLPARGHADDSITYEQATPEQKARIDAMRAEAAKLGHGPGSPGSHPELPAHQDVNNPPLPELNTNRKLSIPLVKQTLNIQEDVPLDATQRAALQNVNSALVNKLDAIQQAAGKRLPINSGYRSRSHNARVGGARNSQHIQGNAVDINVKDLSIEERQKLISTASAHGIQGIGVYKNALHFDLGSRRSWGPSFSSRDIPGWARGVIGQHLRGQFAQAPGQQQPPSTGVSQNQYAQIKQLEGFNPKAYWDDKQWSIGHGTRAKSPNEVITPAEADRRLNAELTSASRMVTRFKPGLPSGVHAALTSLTYNAGTKWQKQGLGRAIKAGDWADAQRRFLQYNKSNGKVLRGLVNRRQIEAQWFSAR